MQLHLLSEQVQNNQNLRTIIQSYTILSIGSYWVTWTFLDLVSAIAGFAQRSTKPFFLGEYGADASASCDHVGVGMGTVGDCRFWYGQLPTWITEACHGYGMCDKETCQVGVTKILDASLLVAITTWIFGDCCDSMMIIQKPEKSLYVEKYQGMTEFWHFCLMIGYQGTHSEIGKPKKLGYHKPYNQPVILSFGLVNHYYILSLTYTRNIWLTYQLIPQKPIYSRHITTTADTRYDARYSVVNEDGPGKPGLRRQMGCFFRDRGIDSKAFTKAMAQGKVMNQLPSGYLT